MDYQSARLEGVIVSDEGAARILMDIAGWGEKNIDWMEDF